MRVAFDPRGLEDYQYWGEFDRKIFKKINQLIADTSRHPFEGLGQPEPLRHNLAGFWSRRITHEHRLVYKAEGETLLITQCRYHYGDN